MKKLLLLICCSCSIFFCSAQKDDGWDDCDYFGSKSVRLKLKLTINDLPLKEIRYSEYDNFFENEKACLDYFNREYNEYPYRNSSFDVAIDIYEKCSPCAAHIKKEKEDTANKSECNKIRNQNIEKFKAARKCFPSEDSFNDALNAAAKVKCGIYLDKVACPNGKVEVEWSRRDANGNKVSVPENERPSIDGFYDEMKEKAKAREINKIAKQIRSAQTQKEMADLLGTLQSLLKSSKDSKGGNDKYANDKVEYLDQNNDGEVEGYKTNNADGSTTFGVDTDDDGNPDQSVTYDKNGKPLNEITIECDNTPVMDYGKKCLSKPCPEKAPNGCLKIKWVGVIDNAEGNKCPHGPSGRFYLAVYKNLSNCPGDQKSYDNWDRNIILYGPTSGDFCPCWPKFPASECEWLDGQDLLMDLFVYKWNYADESVWIVIYESDNKDFPLSGLFRKHETIFCQKISRNETKKINPVLKYSTRPAHGDAIDNCKKKGITWLNKVSSVWNGGLKEGIPSIFIQFITD
ncbi:MAG: hypothetical protein ABI855_11035 [Bacteroidota bacterium]